MSETPGITLTEKAKNLIVNLVKLDTKSKAQKYELFNQLWELWKEDLAAGSNPRNAFTMSKIFIKNTILDSYDELERDAEKLFLTLYRGTSYTTSYGVTFDSNVVEIDRAAKIKAKVTKRVNYQYGRLAEEFDDFVKNRNLCMYKARELVPLNLPAPRESLNRDAKDSITYVGLAATEPDPKKKKKGKMLLVKSDEVESEVEWGDDEWKDDEWEENPDNTQDMVILAIFF